MTVFHDSHCMALHSVTEVIPPNGVAVTVIVVMGPYAIQRRVDGEWADHLKLPEGGVLVMKSTDAIRLVGVAPKGVALMVSEASAAAHLGHLGEDLGAGRLVRLSLDPLILSLGKALITSMYDGVDNLVTKNVMDVLVTRLGQVSRQPLSATEFERTSLPNWRLRRVINYVDGRLDEGISLTEMASVAGLSAMYFAAQFKAATGMRPHHYVIARRIQHAKHLLHRSEHTVLHIALAVGFRTQSHFTTVFKKHESITPARWRRGQLAA
ncbi:AraC-like DNA-binding protein [Luteibacter sp. OK325]|nr:AraC-like DNA-binding protein [Luteibacter sp. OK325]